MNSQEYHSLQEAYMNVYQEVDEAVYGGEQKKPEAPKDTRLVVTNADKKGNTPAYQNLMKGDKRYKAADHMGEETRELDEVRGGGKIDAVSDIPGIGERGSRSPSAAGLEMSPLRRAEKKVVALKRRNDPEATKRANRINSRFVNPTNSAVNRSLLAATNARSAEKRRLMNSYNPDLFDVILEYLITEGYADTNENALVIMANMSEDWRQSIVEEVLDEGYVDYKKGKLPSGRTPQQAAQGRSELLNARERNRPLGKLDGTYSRQQNQGRRTKEMDKLTASNPVNRAMRRGLGDMLPGGQPNTDRHSNAMDRRNRVADLASAKKKSRSRYQHEVDPNY